MLQDTFHAKVLPYLFTLRFIFYHWLLLAVYVRFRALHSSFGLFDSRHFLADMWLGLRQTTKGISPET